MSLLDDAKSFIQKSDLMMATRHDLAAALRINGDTLRRLLRMEHGTSWTLLVAEERKRRCMEQLAKTPDMNLDRLAEITGYCDRSAVERAFRGWHGMTITQWREGAA